MSLRLVITIVACSIALAHNIDGLQEQKTAESSFGTDKLISLFPQLANNPEQHKSMHRRQSPDEDGDSAVCETDSLTPVKIEDISYDTGSLHADKRSLDNVKPVNNVAEPGCCG